MHDDLTDDLRLGRIGRGIKESDQLMCFCCIEPDRHAKFDRFSRFHTAVVRMKGQMFHVHLYLPLTKIVLCRNTLACPRYAMSPILGLITPERNSSCNIDTIMPTDYQGDPVAEKGRRSRSRREGHRCRLGCLWECFEGITMLWHLRDDVSRTRLLHGITVIGTKQVGERRDFSGDAASGGKIIGGDWLCKQTPLGSQRA
jgi:hypothetical protein